MKGDFTRFTYDPRKHYTRVLKQQGRVDLDADWNEAVEIFTRRDRIEATDVIGRCGVPLHDDGFKVEPAPGGGDLTISAGRLYVDGILCERDADGAITEQADLPDYAPPDDDGVYLAYVDVWDRHITYLEDPDIREVALGGPDTTTRTRTVCQVRLLRIGDDGPLELHECEPYPADPSTGTLAAGAASAGAPTNPCAVPEGAGYTGLENRLYRVEIHDDGRAEDGTPGARPVTFKWSRDNGSVVLPVADENGIDGDTVTLKRLGHDEVLTVKVGDWVEILGDETELYGRPGTLGQIVPDGIDRADLEVELDRDVSAHAAEGHLKMRRWDHQETDALALIDGALPLPAGPFELEDGVLIEFPAAGTYHTGDYWVIPARTREGTVQWPQEGTPPAAVPLPPFGIAHHYCTLALVRRTGGVWAEARDCRPTFPPLTEVGEGCCCVSVEPGESIQQAIDTVVAAGGGCVALCEGVHVVRGPLVIRNATDVTLHGEGAATVVRFEGTGPNGFGGLVIEHGRRIAVQDFFAAAAAVPALVSIRHSPEMEPSRQIALRRLLLLNLTASDGETTVASAIRLGHATGITVEECRLAAEVGILSLWGNALPDLQPRDGDDDGEGGAPVLTLDFEELDAGQEFRVGETFTEEGVPVTGQPFQWSNGTFTENGFARVETDGQAGGTGQDLQVNNITLGFAPPVAYNSMVFRFGEFGGNVNLRVNGELRNTGNFDALNGQIVGGVRVTVLGDPDGGPQGTLRLDAEANAISDVGIGGQELWIDDVVFRDPLAPLPDPPRLAYGDGVDDLRMRDTAIRFEAAGVFAARAHRWQIDRADVRPYDSRTLAIARELFREGQQDDEPPREDRPPRPVPTGGPRRRPQDRPASRLRAGQLLSAVETLFTTPGALRGYALLAFRWHGCAVRHSTLAGRHGAHAWWWLRGAVHGCTLQGEESGLHAFWLYEAEWAENTVETEEGVALSVAGCCRARLEHNRLRGPMGVTNVPFGAALDGIDVLLGALRRGYGGSGTVATAVLSGIVVDESLRLMGFGPLLDALQPIVDEASPMPGIPVAYYVAAALLQSLRSQDDNAFLRALPLIDLHVAHNDVACRQQGVGFDAFIPLGSLRVSGNRIHTTTGQAVRIEANLFFANGHLTVFLVRVLLAQLRRLLDRTSRDSDGPLADVLRALRTLVEQWQAGAENLFDLDFRVEGNTIRSLRTAIESNLFELSVLTNHVTMQERTVAEAAVNTGRIFGIVTTPDGGSLPGSTVRVVGTERVATTGDKSEYELVGLPPGTYTLRATRAGYTTAVANVTLSAGEQAEVNFTISPFIVQAIAYFSGAGFSDAVLASQTMAAATASNAEMQQVMQALETSTALEPLAAVLREGAHTLPETYAAFLAASNGPLSTDAQRIAAADAATLIAGQTSDAEVERAAALLNDTLRANDRSLFVPHLTRFIRALQRYVDSQGILVEGLGGRIVENQVVVPADALPDTEALGGIQVSVNLVYLAVLAALGQILFRFLGGDEDEEPDVDPLLGITDTLIDTNEIVGGIGHGVSVQGVAGQPDFVRELRLRGNLIRGMAGAGVFINEHALVVGLDAGGNHVSECGREAGFTQHKGGFVVQTAAVCRFHGNQVVRCGQAFPARDDDQRQGRGLFGIALDAVYDVQCTDNEVQANGIGQQAAGGGILFEEVYGTTAVHDNRVAFNHGFGFRWINNPRGEDDDGDELPPPLPPFLVAFAHDYLRREDEGLDEDEQASVQDNLFRASRETFATAVSLVRLREVIFCGNTARTDVSGLIAGEIFETALGVVSNNLLRVVGEQPAFFISSMNGGVVANNVGNRPIQLFGSPAVIRVHNVPPAV